MVVKKLEFQVPFVIQEALRVAQATAVKVWPLAYPHNVQEQEDMESVATPAPMTVKAKTEYPEAVNP